MVFALMFFIFTSDRITGAIKANAITQFIIERSNSLVIASSTAQTFFSINIYS
jgi:hypothetical protein